MTHFPKRKPRVGVPKKLKRRYYEIRARRRWRKNKIKINKKKQCHHIHTFEKGGFNRLLSKDWKDRRHDSLLESLIRPACACYQVLCLISFLSKLNLMLFETRGIITSVGQFIASVYWNSCFLWIIQSI